MRDSSIILRNILKEAETIKKQGKMANSAKDSVGLT